MLQRCKEDTNIYLYVKNMRIYNFAKCILSACIVVNVCAGYQTRTNRERNKNDHHDGRPMASAVSKKIPYWIKELPHSMKHNCGTTLVIEKHSPPMEVYYEHSESHPADCRLIVHNDDDTFYRTSLQFKEFHEFNGWCIYASNFGPNYNGVRFCSGTPPIIREVYTSLPGKRGFELRVNGSGSAYISFRILLTTFHTGKCYNQTCGNERCVPRSQLCKGAYPCGDDWDCYNPRAPKTDSADHLIIFCCVATGLALLTDVCWRMQAAKAKEEALRNRYRANRDREAGTTRALTESTDHPHAVPSAPQEVDIKLAAARASPSAPPPPAPKSDLPPSYDEVISAGAKYAVNQDPVPSK